jgi:predicted nucleic acid-binding protein
LICFIDTSALFALLDAGDKNHGAAKRIWGSLMTDRAPLVSSNYVLLETISILNRRLGKPAARGFQENIVPLLRLEWVSPEVHSAGISAFLSAGRKNLSLVDQTSFHIMRKSGIRSAFSFDKHFVEQGFELLRT